MLRIMTVSEIELRLKNQRSVLSKIMFHSHSETMSLRCGKIRADIIVEKLTAVVHIGKAGTFFLNDTV